MQTQTDNIPSLTQPLFTASSLATPRAMLEHEREALKAAIAHAEEVGGATAALCAPLHRRHLVAVEEALALVERFEGAAVERAKDFYTTHEAARLFGVTAMTIIRWCEDGLLRFSKTPGGHRRIARTEIEAKALERRVELPWIPVGSAKSKGKRA